MPPRGWRGIVVTGGEEIVKGVGVPAEWQEIRALYKWWTRLRPARKDPLMAKGLKCPPMCWQKVPGSDYCRQVGYDKDKYPDFEKALKQHRRLEKKWDTEDQKNFHRLVDIRGFLWT